MTNWSEGAHGIPRTRQSSLTDDELLICDFIFSSWTSLGLLYADDLREAFGIPYVRTFSHSQMDDLLKGMVDGGTIVRDERRGGVASPFVCLTPKGGELWERERMPVWAAYCTDSRRFENALQVLRVRGQSREVVETFLEITGDPWLPRGAESWSWTIEDDVEIVPWKRGRMVTARVTLTEGPPAGRDWRQFESRRLWWRTVSELLRSHGVLRGKLEWPDPPVLFGQ